MNLKLTPRGRLSHYGDLKNPPPNNPQRGFTLMELMIVITIMGILAAYAMPSYQRMIRRQDVAKASHQLESSLNMARQMAYTSGRPVSICAVQDVTQATADCKDWSAINSDNTKRTTGWVVFYDKDKDSKLDSDEKIYKKVLFNSKQTAIAWTSPRKKKITIHPRGKTGTEGTFRVYTTGLGDLPAWDHDTPPKVQGKLNEFRVALTSLGKVSIRNK